MKGVMMSTQKFIQQIAATEPIGLFAKRYPPIEKIQLDPMRVNTSKDLEVMELLSNVREPILEGKVNGNLEKKFVPIDFSVFQDVGMSTATGPLKVDKHRHPGSMFGLIVKGSLTINGTKLESGDWYVVPPGIEYEMETSEGYQYVFAYVWSC
jgi:hypothetical protein